MKILAYDYQIIARQTPVEDSKIFGRHNANELTITICTGMGRQHQESTMLHEILEAINWQLQLNLDEHKTICLECGLYKVLKDAGVDLKPLMRELDKAGK